MRLLALTLNEYKQQFNIDKNQLAYNIVDTLYECGLAGINIRPIKEIKLPRSKIFNFCYDDYIKCGAMTLPETLSIYDDNNIKIKLTRNECTNIIKECREYLRQK